MARGERNRFGQRIAAALAVLLAAGIVVCAPAAARKRGDDQQQLLGAGCGAVTGQVTVAPFVASSERPQLAVGVGDVFLISLGANPSTGYHWEIVNATAARPFALYGSTMRDMSPAYSQYGRPTYQQMQYSPYGQYPQPQYGQQYPQYGQPQYGQPQYGQPQYGQAGGAVEQLFLFRAVAPGSGTVTFRYVPSGGLAQNVPATNSVTFTIGVGAGSFGC